MKYNDDSLYHVLFVDGGETYCVGWYLNNIFDSNVIKEVIEITDPDMCEKIKQGLPLK